MTFETKSFVTAAVGVLVGVVGLSVYERLTSSAAHAVITGPTTADVNQIIFLDATQSHGQRWRWSATPGAQAVSRGDGIVAFSAPAEGQYELTLIVSSAAGGVFTESEAKHVISVGVAPPSPPRPPTPVPPPTPGSLREAARALALQVPAPARSQAAVVAGVYETVASQIAAGVLRSPVEIDSNIFDQLRQAVTNYDATWGNCINAIHAEVAKRLGNKPTVEAIQKALEEISLGLKGVQ